MLELHPSQNQFFYQEYLRACEIPSDIHEHLPVLHVLAKNCRHVTEMGVREGMSTRAFLATDASLRSYDLELNENLAVLFEKARREFGKDAQYMQADVRQIEIERTDLLFIDTWHCYPQLKVELLLHSAKARKYIVLHDTHTFGLMGEGGGLGLLPALLEFLAEHPEWRVRSHRINNNGLTVLERG